MYTKQAWPTFLEQQTIYALSASSYDSRVYSFGESHTVTLHRSIPKNTPKYTEDTPRSSSVKAKKGWIVSKLYASFNYTPVYRVPTDSNTRIFSTSILTYWGRDKMHGLQFPNDIFKCIFLIENSWIVYKISLKYVS